MEWKSFGTNMLQGALSSAASGIMDSIFGGLKMKRQVNAQKDIFDYQFGKENERQDFLLNHKYALEKQSMEAAGFNPAMMFGGSSQLASVNQPSASAMMPSSDVGDVLGVAQLDIQNKLANAEISKTNADIANTEADTRSKELANALAALQLQGEEKAFGENGFTTTQHAALSNAYNALMGGKLSEERRKGEEISNKNLQRQFDDAHDQIQTDLNLTNARIRDISERLDMDWRRLPLSLALMSAQAFEARESGKLKQHEANLVDEEIRKVAADADYRVKEVENYGLSVDFVKAQTDLFIAEAEKEVALTNLSKADYANRLQDLVMKKWQQSLEFKFGEKDREQTIKHRRQQIISGYVNTITSGISNLGVGYGAASRGVASPTPVAPSAPNPSTDPNNPFASFGGF